MAFRDVSEVEGSATATSVTINRPALAVEGDAMVASIGTSSDTKVTVSPPGGWTFIQEVAAGNNFTVRQYLRVAGASEPASYTWTYSVAVHYAGAIEAYSGRSATPLDGSGSAATLTAPSVTTTQDGCDVLCVWGANVGPAATFTPSADTTLRHDAVNSSTAKRRTIGADLVQATAGATGDKTATCSAGSTYVAFTVALAPASTGTAHTRAPVDALGMSDSAIAARIIRPSIADALGLLDSATRVHTHRRTPVEPLGLADGATPSKVVSRATTDTLGLTDAAATSRALGRTQADALGLADGVAFALVLRRAQVDGLGLTDLASGTRAVSRDHTDALALADTATSARPMARSVADVLGLADPVLSSLARSASVADALGLLDGAATVQLYSRAVPDSLGLSDTHVANLSGANVRVVTDGLGISDTAATAQSHVRVQTDALGLSDSASASRQLARTLVDGVGLTDTANAAILGALLSRAVTDALGLTDVATPRLSVVRLASDVLGFTDSPQVAQAVRREIADALTITDPATRQATYTRAVTDALGLLDSVAFFMPTEWAGPFGMALVVIAKPQANVALTSKAQTAAEVAPKARATLTTR